MKKLVSLILAIMMIAAVGAAFGTSADLTEDGVVGNFTKADTPVPQANSVKIYKEITAYNQDSEDVNASYEYR